MEAILRDLGLGPRKGFREPPDHVSIELAALAAREPCLINPEDAAARGIADGDVVRVFNDRGHILAGAVVTDAIRPGVIRVDEGGWCDPVEPGAKGALRAYGDVDGLTVDRGTS